MKIIDEYYLITISIILVGLPLLFYIKINEPNVYTYNIVIYGDTIDASMLAYYIENKIEDELQMYSKAIKFNITLISPPQVNDFKNEEEKVELSKKLISFCGVERQWMKLLEDTNLKYYIKEYGIYFGETIESSQKNQFKIYSTESSLFNSLKQFGLSNFAAQRFFKKFAKSINNTREFDESNMSPRLQQLSTLSIIKQYFPNVIETDGLKYFSLTLGLDQNYIKKFIFPVVYGNYLHQTNTISAMYKLLPIFCHRNSQIGQSLVLFQSPIKIKEKINLQVSHAKLNFINNKVLQTYSIIKDPQNDRKKYVNVILTQKKAPILEQESESIVSNDSLRTYIKSDIFFIFQNIDSTSTGKQYSYYKTIIDGKIKNDHLYEQFFTIYLKVSGKKKEEGLKQENRKQKADGKLLSKSSFNPIYSITRICAYNCKGYENSIYILISKHKITSTKNLHMFESHNIIYFKKFFVDQSQMPTNKKLQQNQNVYKIYDIDSISDSYELQLNLVKTISAAFIDKVKREYLS